MPLLFEWDPNKARSNSAKSGVSFDEASTAFEDTLVQLRFPVPCIPRTRSDSSCLDIRT